ncbi:hypothetical protein [Burkholderia orbicola]|uniref:hypothetical protein n=1 Tax=Burkholderia orbicola TaxID=2978683 RepID=UPI00264E298E|nr:hypothetical protein [Burkholderia orbicola]MDN7533849.1 hypothetical protein [Burkholderia orbicola]
MSLNQYTADEALTEVDNVLELFLAPVGISKADALDRIIHIVNRYLVLKPTAVEAHAAETATWTKNRYGYSALFNAIAAAVTWRLNQVIDISVEAFENAMIAAAPQTRDALAAGWKLMPSNLTADMRAAALVATSEYVQRTGGNSLDAIYEAAFGAAPKQPATLTQAAHRALAERRRQVAVEGFTPERDDEHDVGRLICAAICYAGADITNHPAGEPPDLWPCTPAWWKPGDDGRNLDKATALLLAASEQLDREAAATSAPASV